jgi:hypothetical protein
MNRLTPAAAGLVVSDTTFAEAVGDPGFCGAYTGAEMEREE